MNRLLLLAFCLTISTSTADYGRTEATNEEEKYIVANLLRKEETQKLQGIVARKANKDEQTEPKQERKKSEEEPEKKVRKELEGVMGLEQEEKTRKRMANTGMVEEEEQNERSKVGMERSARRKHGKRKRKHRHHFSFSVVFGPNQQRVPRVPPRW